MQLWSAGTYACICPLCKANLHDHISSGLHAPELILKRPFNNSIDIWSFGCLIYEFLTGPQLFTVMTFDSQDKYPDHDHFVQLNDNIGQLLDDIIPLVRTYI